MYLFLLSLAVRLVEMMKKYPARAHAEKVYGHLAVEDAAIFIAGGTPPPIAYCDQTLPLRQSRYFHYLTGVDQIGGCFVLFHKGKLTLFLPDVDAEDIMWSGEPLSCQEALEQFDIDAVSYAADVQATLEDISKQGTTIFTPDTTEYSSKAFASLVTAGDKRLFHALDESRLIKDEFELDLMRKAAAITDQCHIKTMSALGKSDNETHLHAEFIYHSLRAGSKFQSYDPICCSGHNCGTLHYVKNDEDFRDPTRQSVLIDAGAEWKCYASDVTRCFPITGQWSKEHLDIYNAVLDMQTQVMEKIKAGTLWDDLHLLSHKVLIDNFLKIGLFQNGTKEEIFDSGASVWFYPHGLGHLLGMDTHDVGGHANYEDPNPMLRYLRLRRPLQTNMVLTNEPGIYFSPFLLANLTEEQSKYVNKELLEKYMSVGGVRIEDDIIVLDDGCEVISHAPKDPEEISRIVLEGLKNTTV